jgi:hypothetical protein
MNDTVNPVLAARADKAFNDMMNALNRHDIDTVRDLISSNSSILNSGGSSIDIKTALKG